MISAIVLIILRLFAIQWLAGAVILVVEQMTMANFPGNLFPRAIVWSGALLILLAVIVWTLAPAISRRVVGNHDAPLAISGLSLADLYAFAFLFIGLYFTLNSMADTLNWFHYTLLQAAAHDYNPERKQNLYSISRPLITLIAGLLCVFRGQRWARRLAARSPETRSESSNQP